MSCDRLHAFVDGELDAADADAFRMHLRGCDACRRELPRVAALAALVEAAGDERLQPSGTAAPRQLRVVGPARSERPAAGPSSSARPRRSGKLVVIAVAVPLLAAAGWLIVLRSSTVRRASDPAALFAELAPMRSLEARVTVAGPDRYRPYSTVRSGASATADHISFAGLAERERLGDWHAIGVASLLAGNREQAIAYLVRAAPSADVAVDRAAVLLASGSEPELEQALELLDGALAAHPRHGAAAWNRALVLARLGLPLGAANEFSDVAALGEPGWSDEARERAAKLRAESKAAETSWRRAWEAGSRLIASGEPPPAGAARDHKGLMRLLFYDAVRSAPTAQRVLALRPLADELDALHGGDALAALVDRVARADFAVRAPLAAIYAGIALGTTRLADDEVARFLARLRRAGNDAADILLGTLVWPGDAQRNLAEVRALATATRDPWFAALAAHEQARRAIAAGDFRAAEVGLETAIAAAGAARVGYRAESLEMELARTRLDLHRLPEARATALEVLRRTRSSGEWAHEQEALQLFAEIVRHRQEIALARAVSRELLEANPDTCTMQRHARLSLANLHMLRLEIDGARRELASAPTCGEPLELQAALILVDLQRFGGTPDDAARVRAALAAQRAGRTLAPADRALADEIEGRLVLATDRARGEALLRDAIRNAEAIASGDQVADKARAYAYSALIFDAGQRGDALGALALIAEEIGAAPPERCALGIAVADERLLIVARGRDGALAHRYDGALRSPVTDVAGMVSDDMLRALAGCPVIAVIARPPVQATSRLLPPELAWSYRLRGAPPPREVLPPSSLVVSGVATPAHLALAPLAPLGPGADPGRPPHVELSGELATPSRVLAAAARATEIELDVHGFVEFGASDGSYLVLAPDADGRYALTAADVAATRLLGAPLVVLAACHGATSAPYLHAAGGLPFSFLRAGARAVLATPGVVEDAQAGAFFAAVRARVRSGQPLSAALRDERMSHLRNAPDSWVRDVIAFEPEENSHADHHSPDRPR